MELKITEMDKEQLMIEIAKIVAQRISIEDIRKRLSDMIYRDILKDIDLKQLTEDTVRTYKNANRVRLSNMADRSLYDLICELAKRINKLECRQK